MISKKSVILLVVASLFKAIVASDIVLQELDDDISLTRSFARSYNSERRGTSHSLDCFNYYIPYIETMNKQYQREFEACRQASIDGYSRAEAATLDKRNKLDSLAGDSCSMLKHCSTIEAADEVFDCYAKVGLDNTKTMYSINTNASENLSDLQEEFRLIDNKEYKCTNDTKRIHEKKIMQSYVDLDNCISNNMEIPNLAEANIESTTVKTTAASTTVPEETTTLKTTAASTTVTAKSTTSEGTTAPTATTVKIEPSTTTEGRKYFKSHFSKHSYAA